MDIMFIKRHGSGVISGHSVHQMHDFYFRSTMQCRQITRLVTQVTDTLIDPDRLLDTDGSPSARRLGDVEQPN
ncbi:MAG: hypothetical protein ACR2PI_09915 [Hyphomicrobiaceae bacterium]